MERGGHIQEAGQPHRAPAQGVRHAWRERATSPLGIPVERRGLRRWLFRMLAEVRVWKNISFKRNRFRVNEVLRFGEAKLSCYGSVWYTSSRAVFKVLTSMCGI